MCEVISQSDYRSFHRADRFGVAVDLVGEHLQAQAVLAAGYGVVGWVFRDFSQQFPLGRVVLVQ